MTREEANQLYRATSVLVVAVSAAMIALLAANQPDGWAWMAIGGLSVVAVRNGIDAVRGVR